MVTEQVACIGNLGRQDRLIATIHDLFLQQLIFDEVKFVQRLLNFLLKVDHLTDEIVAHKQSHILLNNHMVILIYGAPISLCSVLFLSQPKHLLPSLDHFALIGLKLIHKLH